MGCSRRSPGAYPTVGYPLWDWLSHRRRRGSVRTFFRAQERPAMSHTISQTSGKRIGAFFYGSFIRPDVMARGGLRPEHVEVARLSGFDIHVSPHASLS